MGSLYLNRATARLPAADRQTEVIGVYSDVPLETMISKTTSGCHTLNAALNDGRNGGKKMLCKSLHNATKGIKGKMGGKVSSN